MSKVKVVKPEDGLNNMFEDSLLQDTLAITVNTRGVMGKGIALEYKKRYPQGFRLYKQRCLSGLVKPGEPFFQGNSFIMFPTKDHWASPSKIEWIRNGLMRLRDAEIKHRLILPALGCGNGGLKFGAVLPLIHKYLGQVSYDVLVYPPQIQKHLTGIN